MIDRAKELDKTFVVPSLLIAVLSAAIELVGVHLGQKLLIVLGLCGVAVGLMSTLMSYQARGKSLMVMLVVVLMLAFLIHSMLVASILL